MGNGITAQCGQNQLHLVSEEIVDLDTKETLVQYKASAGGRIKGDKGELSIMPNFVITSSCLKVIQHLHGVDSRLNRLVAFLIILSRLRCWRRII